MPRRNTSTCTKNRETGPIGIEPFARIADSTKSERATLIVKQYVKDTQTKYNEVIFPVAKQYAYLKCVIL